ncbi:MAG: winged helix-turn-helix transcriptional regulator [Alistipes sp.]|jgi:Lrp/AsnC family transcriptional regulator for asnA, asnC and gidA|nr:winged helix-turn-helix transcriptional regulator [Alistipes sp.]MBQ5623208.1 winged helix-turn-helix transcriptional regulator [Alistipes sp.]MBQ5913526.1 winged helix-turn-helix transcriptional regulator [Alistipes sp.]
MVKTNLDATDRKILRFLIKNARTPFLEIARECGISGAAIHQRIKKLEELGVIQGSRLVVAPKSLGFDVCAFIMIRTSDITRQQDTVELLSKVPEVVECHYITGSYNLLIKVYCVDNEHLMRTIFDRILHVQGVASTQTYMSLNESFRREIQVDCFKE